MNCFYLINILLFLFTNSCKGKYIRLSPIKCLGQYCLSSGKIINAAYLSRPKLKIIKNDNNNGNNEGNESVKLCDVVPLLVADDPGFILDSLSNDKMKGNTYNNNIVISRDSGLFDNIPYQRFGNKFLKKELYDSIFTLGRKASTIFDQFLIFKDKMDEILDYVIVGLLLEESDNYTDGSLALGGAVVAVRSKFVNNYDSSSLKLPSQLEIDDGVAAIIECHLDELLGLSIALDMNIYSTKDLFDTVCTDATLINQSITADENKMLITATVTARSYDQNDESKNELKADPAWQIFDAMRFLRFTAVEKRAVLRASGVKQIPRPRLGEAALDNLLLEKMDSAVRAEVLRISNGKFGSTSQQLNNSNNFKEEDLVNEVTALMKGISPSNNLPSNDRSKLSKNTTNTVINGDGNGKGRQILLQELEKLLDDGDIEDAKKIREDFIVKTKLRADPTQDEGQYDPYLDQDDWYELARRKAMNNNKNS